MNTCVTTASLSSTPSPSLLELARQAIYRTQSASVASLQRQLKLGYTEASHLLLQLEGELVTPPGSDGFRALLPTVLDRTHEDLPVNTYWVLPGRLMAGEYPGHTSPALTRQKLTSYLEAGINAFLDLTEAHELSPYEDELQALCVNRRPRCLYQRMPIRDVSVPSDPQHMARILDTLDTWLREGRNVYVHCWGGVGRTGTVVGCYLVNQGLTGDAALAHLALLWTRMSPDKRRRKPVSPETPQQMDYVRQWDAPQPTQGD